MAASVNPAESTLTVPASSATDTAPRIQPNQSASRGETVAEASGRRSVRRISRSMSRSR
jgi:hypothetical protein